MYRKILVTILALSIVFSLLSIGTAFAADVPKPAQVPEEAELLTFTGKSTSGNNFVLAVWQDNKSVYVMVEYNSSLSINNPSLNGTTPSAVYDNIDMKALGFVPLNNSKDKFGLLIFQGMNVLPSNSLYIRFGNGNGNLIDGAGNLNFPVCIIRYYDDNEVKFTGSVEKGRDYVIRDSDVLEETGYVFLGWNENKDEAAAGKAQYVAGDIIANVQEDKDLYAVWEKDVFSYTVEYYYDGVKDENATIKDSAEFDSVITGHLDKPKTGYMFDRTEGLPLTISAVVAENVIKVYYVKDDSQTRNVVYTVKYTRDGAEVSADTYTVTVPVWILAPADVTVPIAAISAANDRYVGYKLATNPFVAPAAAKNGDVITVPYVKDDSQTRNVVYTVKYTRDGAEVSADTYTVTVPVWILAPADVAVPVAAIPAANDRYVGYKLANNPFVAPATAKHGDVITVPYVKDENWTKILSYTVESYIDGELAEKEIVAGKVWINDPDTLTVQPVDKNKYLPEYDFDHSDPAALPETIDNGGVIKLYYIKVIFTVSYEPGEHGYFDIEINKDIPYGEQTPAFHGSLENCELGWIFDCWSPGWSDTVTNDVSYIAQWKQIPYRIEFKLGNTAMGDALIGATVFDPVYFGADMPIPPHPYAKFSYKFTGWQGSDGSFIATADYRKPTDLIGYPQTVTGSITYTAMWDYVNPSMQFPDKIPSLAHFDKWWGDYGIICFAASTTKDDNYTVLFADWFYDVYRSCTIGYGSPGKMDYEIRFTKDDITMWNMNSGKEITNKGELKFTSLTCVMDGQYFTKDKNHNYGNDFGGNGRLQGVSFVNPFGSGAKLAWLY